MVGKEQTCFLVCACFVALVASQHPLPHDLAQWQLLFDATNGQFWTRCNTSRDDPCKPIYRDCVSCMFGGGISSVWLDSNNLTGTIPDVSNFTIVQAIDLSHNSLTGTLPQFSAMPRLQMFTASNNMLTGQIPDLHVLSNLQNVELYNNQFSGTIPRLAGMTRLVTASFGINRLTGTIPELTEVPSLISLSVERNELCGTIPSLDHASSLQFLALSDNYLSGTIPRLPDRLRWFGASNNLLQGTIPDLSRNSELVVLDAACNNLRGTIPDLAHITMLYAVALFDNHLTGTLPPLPASVFASSEDYLTPSKNFVLLHNNFLSCDLPRNTEPALDYFAHNNTAVIVAMGNQFSTSGRAPPSWLADEERGAHLLFVANPPMWMSLAATAGFGALAMFVVALIWMRSISTGSNSSPAADPSSAQHKNFGFFKIITTPTLVSSRAQQQPTHQQEDPIVGMLSLASRFLVVLLVIACGGMAPLFYVGANLFQCGETLSRVSLSYTTGAPACEWTIAAFTCIYTVVSAVGVAWLWGCARVHYQDRGVRLARPLGAHWRRTLEANLLVPEEDSRWSVTSETSVSTAQTGDIVHGLTAQPATHKLLRIARLGLVCLLWLFAMAVLSIPTMMYELLDSLPHDNWIGAGERTVDVVRMGTVPLLVLINVALVPVLCSGLVAFGSPELSNENSIRTSVRLQLATRFVLLVIMPVLAVVVLDNGCFQNWKKMWNVCVNDDPIFNSATNGTARFQFFPTAVSTKQICRTQFWSDRCPRRVVQVVSSLMMLKMTFQAFVSPVVLLLWHGVVRPFLLARKPATLNHPLIDRALSPMNTDNFALVVLAWVEVGIVYGSSAPLVLLAVVLSIAVHLVVYRMLCADSLRELTQRSLVCPPTAYLVLSVCVQGALVTWFFVSVGLEGWYVVAGVVPLVCALLVLHLVTRKGGRWVAKIARPRSQRSQKQFL